MTDQLSLLSWKPRARNTDPATSHAAAADAELRASAGRIAVLASLLNGPKTDFELAAATGRQQTSAGKRRGECRDHGLVDVARDGRGEEVKRAAPSGSKALVWQITPAGIAFYENATRRVA